MACATAGKTGVVDAIVIVAAIRHQAPVVCDLTQIADAIGIKVEPYPAWTTQKRCRVRREKVRRPRITPRLR